MLLEGPGHVAITTHGKPLVLTPPVKTDSDGFVVQPYEEGTPQQ